MNSSLLHLGRALMLAALPAALLTSCGGNDDDSPTPTPAPDQGRVMLVHASALNQTLITAFIGDQQVGQLNYGQSSNYLNVNTGSPTLRINDGSTVLVSQALPVAKDVSYSAFVYSSTNAVGAAPPAILTTTDDLTAPASGQAKVRLVHVAVNATSPVRLNGPSSVPGVLGTEIIGDVTFRGASNFFAINPGPLNLVVTGGTPRTELIAVGDGTGSGTGTKNYEAGKIYTIVVRGIGGQGVSSSQQVRATVIQNN